ncbi:MAG: hypothetical protein AAGB93_01460 [Planctomycetota bacterium]
MIAPLRRRHRWLAPGAFAIGAIGLVVAVAARPRSFVAEAARFDRAPSVDASGIEGATALRGSPALWFAEPGPARPSALIATERIEASDVLAYTTQAAEWEGDLPPDAVLVGAVAPLGRTPLGTTSLAAGDRVVLYSLGQKRALRTLSRDDLTGGSD